jgi:uronate dehydrogenase
VTVLVTGAAGRIGSVLAAGLRDRGWTVRGCDLTAAADVTAADIHDLDAMRDLLRNCRSVIHLAGAPNASAGWDAVRRANVDGTRTVLEAARREGCGQVIYASSIHTIGGLPADTALGPDLPPVPSGTYGVTKLAAEGLLRVYAAKGGMRATSVRICSFRPRPGNARERRTWFGRDDCVHLFDRCLRDESPGYHMIWGVSANARMPIDDPTAERIGYRPAQNAEEHLDAIKGDPSVEPWPLMGGPVADDMDTDFRT